MDSRLLNAAGVREGSILEIFGFVPCLAARATTVSAGI
jgi:hypothetical protein